MLGFLYSELLGNYVKKVKAFIQIHIEGFDTLPLEAEPCDSKITAYI